MQKETQRDAILRVLATNDRWVARQELIQATGHPKGYAAIVGNSLGTAGPQTLVGRGWVEVDNSRGRVMYRMTAVGKQNWSAATPPASSALTNWEKALQALVALGGRATIGQIHSWLEKEYGSFSMENIRKDLTMLSVNDKARFAYHAWELRHGRAKAALDRVYAVGGSGAGKLYELYNPQIHGYWELYRTASGTLGLRRMALDESTELRAHQEQVPEYDPSTPADGKKRVLREIAARQGAPAFRHKLLSAFGRTCCVSECRVEEVLEAAHICPYDGANTNDVTNGLLLRSDLHTLFDLGLLRISPHSMEIAVHPRLQSHPEYSSYHKKKLILSYPRPSAKALQEHWARHASTWERSAASQRT